MKRNNIIQDYIPVEFPLLYELYNKKYKHTPRNNVFITFGILQYIILCGTYKNYDNYSYRIKDYV